MPFITPRGGHSSRSTTRAQADSIAARDREVANREYWELIAKKQHEEKQAKRRRY